MQKNYKVDKYTLDDYQMQLLTKDENTLVIAGAGAGKTLTILGKINYLIENKFCLSENILVISFTNASVNDIKTKIDYNINVFTFHKLAINILEKIDFKYTLCSSTLLKYIIEETLKMLPLNDQKIILKFLKIDYKYNKFLKTQQFKSFCNLIETFINQFKTNNYNSSQILTKKFTHLEKKILLIIFNIYEKYQLEKKSAGLLDFDDLIIYATHLTKKANLNYKYIIIDEFQDTSLIRLNLIKEIYKHTTSKVIVVGDDWQSIYRFSGCDLNIFLNFSNEFPNVNKITLVNTYRNSQELITVASKFVLKNPLQISKNLVSEKNNAAPLIFVPFTNKVFCFKKLLNKLIFLSNDIMILSRNNNDIYQYIDNDFNFENNIIYYKGYALKYFTVHRSKGLEAKYVILLNCNNNILGFPNKIENNPIIEKLNPNYEIKNAEERRLFYVAITRCKETTFLLYEKNNPSIFIKEIKRIVKKTLNHIDYFK